MVGDDDAVGTRVRRGAGVLGIEDALDHELPGPLRAQALDVLPGQGPVEIAPGPFQEVEQIGPFVEQVRDIAERMRAAPDPDVPGPVWLAHRLQHTARLAPEARGRVQAGMGVAIARAGDRQVDGEQEDGAIMAVETLAGKELAWFISNLNEGVRDVSPSERVFIS